MAETSVNVVNTHETIEEMVQRIVKGFAPEKIILFGSHARGTAGPDSDVDLLVVIKEEGSKRKKATDIDVALVGVALPVDVIVVSPDDLERRRDQVGTVIHSVLREGKLLYERAA